MEKWLNELAQAPRDAWALILGLASACSIFALVRQEFVSAPIHELIENWSYWSHQAWDSLAQLVDLRVNEATAIGLTTAALVCAIYLRGKLRGQDVETEIGLRVGWGITILLLMSGFLLAGRTDLAPPNTFELILRVMAFLAIVGVGGQTVGTPRSLFGVVIAAIALLLIDRIPLLPAATSAAQP